MPGGTDTPLCAETGPIASPLHPEPESALLSPSPENNGIKSWDQAIVLTQSHKQVLSLCTQVPNQVLHCKRRLSESEFQPH